MKHHVVIVYQTVPPQGINHQIFRNIAARKIYLHINIPRVSSALKKKSEKRVFFNQKTVLYTYCFSCYIVYNAYIEE